MAIKPRCKGIPSVTKYAAIDDLANRVFASMTGNANFAVPSPALATIQAAEVTLAAAIATWGPVGARGSHVDLMAVRSASLVVRNLLVQEMAYVLAVVVSNGGDYALQAAAITTSGFGVKNPGTPQGLLGQVVNFHQVFKNSISIYKVGLAWEKPVGITSPGNVKSYQIWRNSTIPDFNHAQTKIIGTSSKTSFIDSSPDKTSPTNFFWITSLNTAGIGAPTATLEVIIVP